VIQPAAEWAAWLEKRLEQLSEGTIWQSLLAVAERGVQEAANELGANDPAVACFLDLQATLLQVIAQYEDAEHLYRRALAIDEASYGNDHPNVARDLNNLARLLHDTNRLAEAEPLMRRALTINEASYGNDHPEVAIRLNNLANLLRDTNRLTEAEALSGRAAAEERRFSFERPLMGTRFAIICHGSEEAVAKAAADEAFAEGEKINAVASDYLPDSELMRLPSGGAAVEVSPLLADLLEGSRTMAERCGGAFDPTLGPLTVLVNNAGVMGAAPLPDGRDTHLVANHLGPYLLTRLMLPAMAPGGRVVNVASR
jgi:tetratricopeptide (TPR) repeat protein